MRFFQLFLAVGMALPAVAGGQRTRQPSQTGRLVIREQLPPDFKEKDLANLNPARIALDHRKDLELNPDQSKRLDSIQRAFDERARTFGVSLDTLQNILDRARSNAQKDARERANRRPRDRPESGKDSIEQARKDSIDQSKSDRDRERTMAARNGLGATFLTIREIYDSFISATNAVLTNEQRSKIGPWLEGVSTELTTRMHWANQR